MGRHGLDVSQERGTWRALVNAVLNLQVPQDEGNFLTSCTPVSFSRRTLLYGVSNKLTNILLFDTTHHNCIVPAAR